VSIINEALSKIQQKRSAASVEPGQSELSSTAQMAAPSPKRQSRQVVPVATPKTSMKWPSGNNKTILFAVMFLFCLAGGYSLISVFSPVSHDDDKELVLNGVFISDQMKVAMINRQSYQVGDKIGDMKVVAIEHQSVKLKHGSEDLNLRVSA
jgi:hypothetical protein